MISGLVQEAKEDVLVHCSLEMRKPFLLPSEVLYMDFVECTLLFSLASINQKRSCPIKNNPFSAA